MVEETVYLVVQACHPESRETVNQVTHINEVVVYGICTVDDAASPSAWVFQMKVKVTHADKGFRIS